ncbi:MAG: hypothetical protein V3S51_01620 [Dehalococcoidia bacterium]
MVERCCAASKGSKEGTADDKDTTLCYPEITQSRLHWSRSDVAQVFTTHRRSTGRDGPHETRIRHDWDFPFRPSIRLSPALIPVYADANAALGGSLRQYNLPGYDTVTGATESKSYIALVAKGLVGKARAAYPP